MTTISARDKEHRALNECVKAAPPGEVRLTDCYGQRFIGSALTGKKLIISGTPGNALGAYLDGGVIEVHGNAQDAVGDTMNDGAIILHGHAGDALGYAMRGGAIFVKGNAGYRAGIHMKEYKDKKPVIIIGGKAGSFLGEYLAGGIIAVLGIGMDSFPAGHFTGTGMHGGKIFIRTAHKPARLPAQVIAERADEQAMAELAPYMHSFAGHFGLDAQALLCDGFYVLRPNARNPYKQLYTAN